MSEQTLQEFIDLWEREFGERIDRGDAEVRAKQLVTLFKHLMTVMEKVERQPLESDGPRQDHSVA